MDPVAERSLSPATLRRALLDRLTRSLGKDPGAATPRDFYDALSLAVREELTSRWLATQRRIASGRAKRVCYLSVEFLPGRSLVNALSSLDGGMVDEARRVLADYGLELDKLAALEVDPGLGNGGLGRLAACFLDSLATLQYPAVGYGIRYDYGIFTQRIAEDGGQRELASTWLRLRNPWEIPRSDARYKVRFGGGSGAHEVLAVGFDHLVPGNRSPTVNHLRLWSGRGVVPFRIESFNRGQYAEAVAEQVDAKNLSRVLYPDDSTPQGRELRLRQQFFFVSASLQDLLATHLAEGRSLEDLPRCIAIQLNDTHPALAIAELLRLLVDEHGLDWDRARLLGEEIFGYTNHTLLPEALETWPVEFFERLLPRHLQIIYLINRDFLASVEAVDPGNHELRRRVSIIDEEHGRQVRMSHLAVIGSRRVNGVARLHSRLMRDTIFADFAALLPGRFTNVTNGIATRRWLKQSNPGLSALLTEHLGHAWENDLEELSRLDWALADPDFLARFLDIKRDNKRRLADVVAARTGVTIDPESMFDVQVKRIHEYKRQTLNLLSVVARYLRIRDGDLSLTPRTVLFAGKAAPGYFMAKTLIRVINLVARTVNADPATRDLLRVVFLPDYDVSLAQQIMPAADLSQQISTAGMEASGTGNMKLALNGALTMGTLDGANIEIAEAVGRDQVFIFGLDAEGVVQRRTAGYVPREFVSASPALAGVMDALASGQLTGGDEALPLVDRLLGEGEPYLVLADFDDYQRAQGEADRLFLDRQGWTRRAAANTLAMGPFSSDRSIREYAGRIWGLEPLT